MLRCLSEATWLSRRSCNPRHLRTTGTSSSGQNHPVEIEAAEVGAKVGRIVVLGLPAIHDPLQSCLESNVGALREFLGTFTFTMIKLANPSFSPCYIRPLNDGSRGAGSGSNAGVPVGISLSSNRPWFFVRPPPPSNLAQSSDKYSTPAAWRGKPWKQALWWALHCDTP